MRPRLAETYPKNRGQVTIPLNAHAATFTRILLTSGIRADELSKLLRNLPWFGCKISPGCTDSLHNSALFASDCSPNKEQGREWWLNGEHGKGSQQ